MKSSRIVKLALLGVVLFGGVKTEFADTAYLFTPIDVPGAFETIPQGINNGGGIVGWVGLPIGAFLYSGGIYTTFSVPGGLQTEAHGINNRSQIVGEYAEVMPARFHGFLRNAWGGFTAIDVPSATAVTLAHGINDSGQIVGYFFDGTEYHGFLDNGGSFIPITYPGAACPNGFSCGTFATGINDSGQVVGYFGDAAGVTHGFLYSNGSFSTIDYPGLTCPPNPTIGCGTFLTGINRSGQIVGYIRVPIPIPGGFRLTIHGFLDTGGTFTMIDYPVNPDTTLLWGINDSGQIVGSFIDPNTDATHGFLATPVAMP